MQDSDILNVLISSTEEYRNEDLEKFYLNNFDHINKLIEEDDPKLLNISADFLMSIKSFKKASYVWRKIYNNTGGRIKQYRLVKMIRCLYYSGDIAAARFIIREKLSDELITDKNKAVLFSVMAESGDDYYLTFLGKGIQAEDLDDPFFKERSALLCVDQRPEVFLEKKFIFVSGTPRSGTTSLGAFLNTHNKICMATERYGPGNGYSKSMLSRDIIFHEEGYKEKYNNLYNKYNSSIYIGDKRPNFLMSWGLTKNNFEPSDIKVIHLFRNPYFVAESYFKRAKKNAVGEDAWSSKNITPRDQFVACWDYNINNKTIRELMTDGKFSESFLYVISENLYSKESNLLDIFDYLGLAINDEVRMEAKRQVEKSKLLGGDRDISNETIDLVDKHFDFNLFHQVKRYSI
ncbi:sulfotransferase [Microbulbifer sp. CnH-101-E]|uniref:sulfotransferase n=1 Tax=unclassified Microbulbifer TaxID=2619833 RepID=UPI0040393342